MFREVILDADEVRAIIPNRPLNAHKGSVGKVLVIAGSRGMAGAAILASRAVMRSGAGLVTLASAAPLVDLIDINNLEVMTFPLPATKAGAIHRDAGETLKKALAHFDVVLIGPGLSTDKGTIDLVADLLGFISRKMPKLKVVLDADGLRALRKFIRRLRLNLIITPHLGELTRLVGNYTSAEVKARPQHFAWKIANKYNCTVVLKISNLTYVFRAGFRDYFLNSNGNPGMATAGVGDVLAGIITGLWARTDSSLQAAAAGTYIHAAAGNVAANRKSIDGIIASDILESLPEALRLVKGI